MNGSLCHRFLSLCRLPQRVMDSTQAAAAPAEPSHWEGEDTATASMDTDGECLTHLPDAYMAYTANYPF
jgi:hypothetical protein